MNNGYLRTHSKFECFGCEACAQVCPNIAISMAEDDEGFRYPSVNKDLCIHCELCNKVCPYENFSIRHRDEKYVFGGYIENKDIRNKSTSGGAFSAIVDTWCDERYVIFGASANGLDVFHKFIIDKKDLELFRKSKYSQSRIGTAYVDVREYLKDGKKVLFSGTPCQIAGLQSLLKNTDQTQLLTVEVICEGIPSPWYIKKYNEWCIKKYGSPIESLDYRYKDGKRWDFEVMMTQLKVQRKLQNQEKKLMSGCKAKRKNFKVDRWFNPFWTIWLNHLMSRPSCYKCPFASSERGADISLGDLWGTHIYCPELYGKNGGASLIVCNTKKGKEVVKKAETQMYGHELEFTTALKYQGPMRKPISMNPEREDFMKDLLGTMDYKAINRKWTKPPSLKLLWQKYIWGNRQKVALWRFKQRFMKR